MLKYCFKVHFHKSTLQVNCTITDRDKPVETLAIEVAGIGVDDFKERFPGTYRVIRKTAIEQIPSLIPKWD